MRILKVIAIIYLSSFSHVVWSGGLERLFTTAQERRDLNQERISPHLSSKPETSKQKKEEIPPVSLPSPPEEIIFNGLLIRNQGSPTVWVNGSEELFRNNFKIVLEKREGLSVPIVLAHQEKEEIWLKPGETRTVEGKILKSYERPSSRTDR